MQTERQAAFREKAVELNLMVEFRSHKDEKWRHFFDINAGSFYSFDDKPETVKRLVELARECAEDVGYGEHNALIQLVALKTEIVKWERKEGDKTLMWQRSYYAIPIRLPAKERAREEEKWITLLGFLKARNLKPDLKREEPC
jgi:hypothetical protein